MNLKAGVRMLIRAGLLLSALHSGVADSPVSLRLRGGPESSFLPEVPSATFPVEAQSFRKLRTQVMVIERHVVKLSDGREGYMIFPARRASRAFVWWLPRLKYGTTSERTIGDLTRLGARSSRRFLPQLDIRHLSG